MALNGVSTPAVMAAGVGALVLWSAIKGASIGSGFRALLGGKQPSGQNVNQITGDPITDSPQGSSSVSASSGANGSQIVNDAMQYLNAGHVYAWGGGSPSGWDCSGFCNWVIGHDLGLPIPGSSSGRFSGHGPTTIQWALYGTGIKRSQVSAGDLVVWPLHHMGIAINGTQMINCPGPNGTPAPVLSPVDENIGGPVVYRRVGTTANISGRA